MRRNHVRRILAVLLVAMLLSSSAFSLVGCNSKVEDLPPTTDIPKKKNNNLTSQLNQLVDAEKRGEAELYARQHGIDLVDGSVSVVIESVSGRLDDVINTAAEFGTIEAVAERAENVQALIPITSLTALAREESIHFIRLPVKPTPTS